jgi:type I restriction enzyme S subunit
MNLLLEHFNLLTGQPEHIAKLKGLILQLAVQGKLVPQDPNDEPASELLKRRRTKEVSASARNKKGLPLYANDQKYNNDIPQSWIWTSLDELGEVNPRNYLEDDVEVSFVPMTLISADYGVHPSFETRKWREIKTGFTHFKEDDVVLAKITPCFENSKAGLMRGLVNRFGAGTTELHVFRGERDIVLPEYVYIYFKSSNFLFNGEAKMTGSAGQKRVPRSYVASAPFPLPPLKEQRRIVARVDELINQLEVMNKIATQVRESRKQVGHAMLHQLGNAASPADLERSWSRIAGHFGDVFSDGSNVKALRQTILQLAVQGKLVPQDPADEPAAVLLERIKAEKERLVREKKLKKEAPLPPISAEEIPYELPEGWVWCRLGEVCNLITDGTHHTPTYVDQGVPFLSVKDINKGSIDFSNCKFITQEEHSQLIKRCCPEHGDVLLTKIGNTGTAKVVDTKEPFSIFVSVALLKFEKQHIDPYFLELLINSPFVKAQSKAGTEGVGNKNLVLRKIYNFLIPLPPLAEQQRIVAKVESLLALCDQLETTISQSEEQAGKLLQAVLKEAVRAEKVVEDVV